MNDLAVSISVSYFPRNMMRKRLFSLITKSVKSSFKRVSSFRKGIYDALGNVWLIKIEITKSKSSFHFSQTKSLFYVIRERMKGLLDKMELSRSNVLWLIGVDHFERIFIVFTRKSPPSTV